MSNPVTKESRREALRGAEVHAVDLMFELFTSEQVAEWMKALLQLAAAKGTRDLAQSLVRAGAEIEDALHEAIKGGHREIVSDLLESGASLVATCTGGYTPLHLAANFGNTEIVQLFLLKGADKDAFGNQEFTPLFLAVSQGRVVAARTLLAAGADVSLRCGQLKAPVIHEAAKLGHVEILRAVIELGADVDAFDTDQTTALHLAALNNHTDAIDVLVEAGASIEARNAIGCTPVHHAALGLRREALLSLLKHGATVDAQNDFLHTPLIVAALRAGSQEAAEVVDSLLRAGADETIVESGGTRAADVVGEYVEEADRSVADIEHIRALLANAPADRAWRRRGYLVLCRAHQDRMQQSQVISGTHHTDTGRMTRSRARLANAGGIAGRSTANESTGGDWTVVASKVLLLQEEGIFRTIVGYL